MDAKTCCIIILLIPAISEAWKSPGDERGDGRDLRRRLHYHSKRHMLPRDSEPKRRPTTQRPRELRKKPSGHLTPLDEDDMENDEVVSVAIGPPPIRPKYDKVLRKHSPNLEKNVTNITTTNLIRNILTQLGSEFLTHQVNEDFVFGQYVGIAMRNLTGELRLKMQHEILDLIVKYQKINRGDVLKPEEKTESNKESTLQVLKEFKGEKKTVSNDSDSVGWPDLTNLAKIVG
ncbi:uncharacterized protein LOC113513961 [Galleria mellonella]|uniref:Uncharacterized protein LOC113513961 n=1 Tax=Galleria mellonella TaxID=7137 RepID=A0A6J3C2H1_GALME|nr:uncharacterized protein LOC113513961 [Galleria mellonella]